MLLLLALACSGSADPKGTAAPEKLKVVTTSFPADWLVRQLGGPRVSVENVMRAGEDPRDGAPAGTVVAAMASADLIVANGAGYEAWMETATLPQGKIVLSADGADLIEIESTTHSHGKDGYHSHAGTDPHTWQDPSVYKAQALAVHAGLKQVAPGAMHEDLARNLQTVSASLDALDASAEAALAPLKERPLASNHPAWGYLERRYGLQITDFDFAPDALPSEKALAAWTEWADANPDPDILIWESAPTPQVAMAFGAGVTHIQLDPLEGPADGQYDYVRQYTTNINTLKGLIH